MHKTVHLPLNNSISFSPLTFELLLAALNNHEFNNLVRVSLEYVSGTGSVTESLSFKTRVKI